MLSTDGNNEHHQNHSHTLQTHLNITYNSISTHHCNSIHTVKSQSSTTPVSVSPISSSQPETSIRFRPIFYSFPDFQITRHNSIISISNNFSISKQPSTKRNPQIHPIRSYFRILIHHLQLILLNLVITLLQLILLQISFSASNRFNKPFKQIQQKS